MHRWVLLVGLSVTTAGCSTVLSTFTPAPTTPAGHVRGSGALGVNLPIGQLDDAFEAGERVSEKAQRGEPLTEQEQREVLAAAAGLLLNPPSIDWHAQGRIGLLDRFDVGIRGSTTGAVRLDGRFELVPRDDDGFAVSIGAGVGYYSRDFGLPEEFDGVIETSGFRRFELDIPVLMGWSGTFGHLWFGPKLVATTHRADLTLTFNDTSETATLRGRSLFAGGQLGAAIGYDFIWLAAEVTVMHLEAGADIEAVSQTTSTTFDGPVIFAAAGLILEI